jgi:hypothetical protein
MLLTSNAVFFGSRPNRVGAGDLLPLGQRRGERL